MDYATKWPEAVALKSVDNETVARTLVELFARIRLPKEILTDQGSNFVSKFMIEFYHLTGVTPIKQVYIIHKLMAWLNVLMLC